MASTRKTTRSKAKPKLKARKQRPARPKATKSWAAFDRAAKRVIASYRPGSIASAKKEFRDEGLDVPDDLVRLAVSIDDGARIDLSTLDGSTTQDLHDVSGLVDANHSEEGSFGVLVAAGDVPAGLLMFGYGSTQLVYDSSGALGKKGSIWQCQDLDTSDAVRLADSLQGLLERALPFVVEKLKPPPRQPKVSPTPAPFSAPLEREDLFRVVTSAPTAWFVLQRGSALWFRGQAGALAAFDTTTQRWTTLRPLPAGFETPKLVALHDGSVMAFAWDYPTKKHLCVRGDGQLAWEPAAGLPSNIQDSFFGLGVHFDGRVLVAGGSVDQPGGDNRSWFYELTRDAWSAGPQLPERAAFERSMQAANGVHLLSWSGEQYWPRVFSLDENGRWHVARSSESASQFEVAPLADGRFALVLAEERDASCLVYDPIARALSPLARLPQTESTSAVCALVGGVIASVRKLPSTREFMAFLDLGKGGWCTGPLLPAGWTAHHATRVSDDVFVFCRKLDPGSYFGELREEIHLLVASGEALLAAR